MAMTRVNCITLSKSFFHDKIVPKHPVICKQIRKLSEQRYIKNIRKVLND